MVPSRLIRTSAPARSTPQVPQIAYSQPVSLQYPSLFSFNAHITYSAVLDPIHSTIGGLSQAYGHSINPHSYESMSPKPIVQRRRITQTEEVSIPDLATRLTVWLNTITDDPNFLGYDTYTLKPKPTLLSVEPRKAVHELKIGSHLCNKLGILSGGAAATLMDILTSMSLITIAQPGFADAGSVSRTITMSYLRAVPMGSTVRIESEVQSTSKNTASLFGRMFLDERICLTCVHDKIIFSTSATERL